MIYRIYSRISRIEKNCSKIWPKLKIFNFAGEFWIASKQTNKDSKRFYEAVNVDPRISRIDKV